jgi:hypothetical protein
MCDDSPSSYRTNAKAPETERLSRRPWLLRRRSWQLYTLGSVIGVAFGLLPMYLEHRYYPSSPQPSPLPAKPAPTCKDSFEWITDRCDEPLKHTCEPGQKLEMPKEGTSTYMICRCK